jgi:hypothetical protein
LLLWLLLLWLSCLLLSDMLLLLRGLLLVRRRLLPLLCMPPLGGLLRVVPQVFRRILLSALTLLCSQPLVLRCLRGPPLRHCLGSLASVHAGWRVASACVSLVTRRVQRRALSVCVHVPALLTRLHPVLPLKRCLVHQALLHLPAVCVLRPLLLLLLLKVPVSMRVVGVRLCLIIHLQQLAAAVPQRRDVALVQLPVLCVAVVMPRQPVVQLCMCCVRVVEVEVRLLQMVLMLLCVRVIQQLPQRHAIVVRILQPPGWLRGGGG